MRILALVPGGIGDQILFFPTLDDLKATYPDAQIDVVVESSAKAAYRVSKSISDTILFDFNGSNSLADWGNLLGVLRDREYDIAISLSQGWGTGFLLWLSGIPTRIGFGDGDSPTEAFFTRKIALNTDQYEAAVYHDILKGLDIDKPLSEIAVSVPTKDLEWADAERKRLGLQDGGYVLMYPGADARRSRLRKSYPIENWQKIIQDFKQKQPDLPLVLIADEENAALVAELVKLCPGIKISAPENMGQLVAMTAGASLVLSTDGAPMYAAIAAQTFTLALLGETDPEKILPNSDRVLGIKSPTGKMADISPQMVLDRVWGG
ncbi:MAG: glycosyltransferase family 9 protein [Leptolyngbya sp. Prado105]|jgi:ADP-heptose:LPS heptosyltransferase|nr:glycosyltransferase family 9 protein [Leptolyngbya sp. Prado105]